MTGERPRRDLLRTASGLAPLGGMTMLAGCSDILGTEPDDEDAESGTMTPDEGVQLASTEPVRVDDAPTTFAIDYDEETGTATVEYLGTDVVDAGGSVAECGEPGVAILVAGEYRGCMTFPLASGDTVTVEADPEAEVAVVWVDPGANAPVVVGSEDVGATGPAAGAVPDSARYHWRFDEGTGTTAADDVGDNDGTLSGPAWTSGTWVGDYALDFPGADYVQLADENGQYPAGSFTVAATIRPHTTTYANGYGPIVDLNHSASSYDGRNGGIKVDHNDGGTIGLSFMASDTPRGTNGEGIETTEAVDVEQVTRVVAGRDVSAGEAYVYLDTELAASAPCGTGDIVYDYDSVYDDDSVHVGKFDRGSLGNGPSYFDGLVDDVIVADAWWGDEDRQSDYDRQPWV